MDSNRCREFHSAILDTVNEIHHKGILKFGDGVSCFEAFTYFVKVRQSLHDFARHLYDILLLPRKTLLVWVTWRVIPTVKQRHLSSRRGLYGGISITIQSFYCRVHTSHVQPPRFELRPVLHPRAPVVDEGVVGRGQALERWPTLCLHGDTPVIHRAMVVRVLAVARRL